MLHPLLVLAAIAVPTAPPVAITDGAAVSTCAWPSAVKVSMGGQCSGVLVHPRVVLLDDTCPAYSGGDTLEFGFGEGSVSDVSVSIGFDRCTFDGRLGFCVLPDPVDVPFAPIIAGCELAALHEGTQMAAVGFGTTDPEMFQVGKKRGDVTVTSIAGMTIFVEGEQLPCTGDTGSPAFVEMEDGTWRVAGIATTDTCGATGSYLAVNPAIAWIEETSGIDITPCHDADGLPEGGSACGGFFTGGDGAWNDLCGDAPVGGEGGVCSGDTSPPAVTITSPDADAVLPDVPATLTVEIDAEDAAGLGVKDVRLEIDGDLQEQQDTDPPYAFELQLPEGSYALVAVARDWGGNVGQSTPVAVIVGDPPPDDETSTGGGEGSGDETSVPDASDSSGAATSGNQPDEGDTDDPEADDALGERGCACRNVPHRGAPWLWALSWLFVRRRARARRHSCVPSRKNSIVFVGWSTRARV